MHNLQKIITITLIKTNSKKIYKTKNKSNDRRMINKKLKIILSTFDFELKLIDDLREFGRLISQKAS